MMSSIAARWILDILDLPRDSAVGFGTSATACTLACLSAARRSLLSRLGWDFNRDGLVGAPEVGRSLYRGRECPYCVGGNPVCVPKRYPLGDHLAQDLGEAGDRRCWVGSGGEQHQWHGRQEWKPRLRRVERHQCPRHTDKGAERDAKTSLRGGHPAVA